MNLRCVNCSLRIARIRRHRLSEASDELFDRVRRWVYPRDITGSDFVCHACWELMNRSPNEEEQGIGHRNICIGCGRSILRIRSRLLLRPNMSERETLVRNVISQWIQPRQLTPSDEVCVPCFLRAQRAADSQNQRESHIVDELEQSTNQPIQEQHNVTVQTSGSITESGPESPALQPQSESGGESSTEQAQSQSERESTAEQASIQTIPAQQVRLPTLKRAPDTARHCLFLECDDREKRRVPDSLRRHIVKTYHFYIPRNARICDFHLTSNMFHELYAAENAMSTFTPEQIEEMLFLLVEEEEKIDFSNPETIDDHLFQTWFGRTKTEYRQIIAETPRIQNKKIICGLNALLLKMRTGDSDERIASLFKIPRRTLERYMDEAREILVQDYVPQHLGFGHLTREELILRNSMLAENLFGNPEAPVEERQLIVIADGTYLDTQKSSNYLFQKQTYSLHKYYNLVKPFVMVCCDGYIIDTYGPYPATKNDASIMNDLLDEDSFTGQLRENDVFILDRGFRDSQDKIIEKGFQVHMPETVMQGERQLTTLQANLTRCVTMNRWVVEAVNGRFSRDFKIFRQDYFNKRCPHIMQEFSIAAALLNHFAVQFQERTNVTEIINIIHEKIFSDNHLGEIVRENNLNMRHSMFHNITQSNIQFPELNMTDLELISLGTYQIRQAKSYVGEHLRAHGLYAIQVCRDEIPLLTAIQGYYGDTIDPYIFRAKIKSRHVGGKSYFTYILIDRGLEGRNAILGHFCYCPAGKRTVGCCSHIMSILWYMGYARHQSYVAAPAAFLDDLLIN